MSNHESLTHPDAIPSLDALFNTYKKHRHPPTQDQLRMWLYREIRQLMQNSTSTELTQYYHDVLHHGAKHDCGREMPNGSITRCPKCKDFVDALPIDWQANPNLRTLFQEYGSIQSESANG